MPTKEDLKRLKTNGFEIVKSTGKSDVYAAQGVRLRVTRNSKKAIGPRLDKAIARLAKVPRETTESSCDVLKEYLQEIVELKIPKTVHAVLMDLTIPRDQRKAILKIVTS